MSRSNPKPPDKEFVAVLRKLLRESPSGRLKDVALDLGVHESTVSRWNSESCSPTPVVREAVIIRHQESEKKKRERSMRRLRWFLARATPEARNGIRDLLSGKEPSQALLDEIAQLLLESEECA